MKRLSELLIIDNPLPTSPLSGGGVFLKLFKFPTLIRGGLGWGFLEKLFSLNFEKDRIENNNFYKMI
jgi:hypothetical protein